MCAIPHILLFMSILGEKRYDMNMDDNILFYPVLKKNEITDLETHFIVESKKIDVEYIKFIFINKKKKEQVIKIKKEDFRYAYKAFM